MAGRKSSELEPGDGLGLKTPKRKAAPKKRTARQQSILTEQRRTAYAEARSSGLDIATSLATAGYNPDHPSTGTELENHPTVKDLMKAEGRKNAYMLGLSREDVLKGMMEAVDQAKLIADPMTQIAGWREIAKICGFYAPEVKRIEIGDSAKAYIQRMEQLDDAELLKLVNSEIIEAEFTEVDSGE